MYLNPDQGYLNLLRTHHRVSVEVYILNSQRQYLFNMTDALIAGTVDIDTESSTATRSGSVTLLDPQQRLTIDFNGAGYGSNMTNRMVQIVYRIYSMNWGTTYAVPIFTGPVVDSKRDGVVINITFAGMEFLLEGGAYMSYSRPAGWSRSTIIMDTARTWGGIVDFNDQVYPSPVLQSPFSIEAGDDLWPRMQEQARAQGAHIFFNGNGVLQIKPRNYSPVFLMDTTWLTEEPDYILDVKKIKNVVRVEGANAPGTDSPMVYEAWPPASHPFSPQSLARNGVPRLITHHVRDNTLKTWEDISTLAWHTLEVDLLAGESTTAVCAVAPFLEEHDMVTVYHPKLYANTPLTKASIPLVGDGEMSLNFFSSTSTGSLAGGTGIRSGGGLYGFMDGGGTPSADRLIKHHGPSGAFNGLGGRGGGKPGRYGDKPTGMVNSNINKGKKKRNRNRHGGK